jgi:hypothetical protein
MFKPPIINHKEDSLLTVMIDLVPGGYESHRRTIGSMRIANVSDLANVSDYSIHVIEGPNPLTGTPRRNTQCIVVGHDRRQSVWALLEVILGELEKADWVPL